jgi:hypothetical protein
MFGIVGTIGVIIQMALISTGFNTKIAMVIGLISCVAWVGHSIKQQDRNLLITNVIVAGFAVWGLAN